MSDTSHSKVFFQFHCDVCGKTTLFPQAEIYKYIRDGFPTCCGLKVIVEKVQAAHDERRDVDS